MTEKKFKIPKKLGAVADRLYAVKRKRLEAQKVVDHLKAEQTALENHLIDNLPKSDASGVAGSVASASVYKKVVPQVEDWGTFYKYIHKTRAYELLQRRVNARAIEERWEDGKQVKGVGHFTVVKVSIKKV